MSKDNSKKYSTVLISLVLFFSFFLISGGDLVQKAEAQDFTISTFTGGTHRWTSSSNDRYNQSTGTLELDYPLASKNANLVGYWRYSANSATQVDETDLDNDGSVSGATYNATGKHGSAYEYAGGADYIQVPDDNSLDIVDGTYSITFWINLRSVQAASDILMIHGGWAVAGYYFETRNTPAIRWIYDAQAGNTYDTATIAYNTWYYFAFVCDGGTHLIYQNGTLSKSQTSNDCSGAAAATDLYTGYTGDAFDGVLDELKIYNDTLTATEVAEMYNHDSQYVHADIYDEIQISNNASWSGQSDYDPQIFDNSKGDLVLIYGNEEGNTNDRVVAQYSTDNGYTWSSRTVLFSNDTQNDGIIDSNEGGMWEFSGEVVSDVLYMSMHWLESGTTIRTLFTKCDITVASNITDYSNWMSADDTPVPSSGGGSNGNGYDVLWGVDGTLAVQASNNIMIHVLTNPVPSTANVTIHYWDGSWNTGQKVLPENTQAVSNLRHLSEGDWVGTSTMDAADGNDYIVAYRCDSGADCTLNASWTAFDGTSGASGWGMDYVLDYTGYGGGFHWGNLQVDASNYTHVTAIGKWTNPTWSNKQIYHNYWDGTTWSENTNVNDAGTQINISANLPSSGNLSRQMFMSADGYGNIILVYNQIITKVGMTSIKWDADTELWSANDWLEAAHSLAVVGTGYMRGDSTVSYFFGTNSTHSYILGVHQGESGSPFWDSGASGITQNNGNWLSASQTMTANYYLLNFTITHDNLTANTYIDKVQFRNATDDSLVAEYGTDINSGTSTTITTATYRSLSDVDMNFKVRIFLVGNSTDTPTIQNIEGYYEASNTAPTIVGCPTETLSYREGENIQIAFDFTDNVGDVITWTSDTTWLDIDSSTGETSGNTFVVDNDQTFTVVITATDTGLLTDTCNLSLRIRNLPDPKQPKGFDFNFTCTQVSYKEMDCYLTESYGVPFDRLSITWKFGENSTYYTGWRVLHVMEDGLAIGQTIKVTCTIEPLNKTASPKSKVKFIEGNQIPFWIWLLIIGVLLFFIIGLLLKEREKRTKGKKKKHPKLNKSGKTIAWTAALITSLGLILYEKELGLPSNEFIGVSLWFILGVLILIPVIYFLLKFLVKKRR